MGKNQTPCFKLFLELIWMESHHVRYLLILQVNFFPLTPLKVIEVTRGHQQFLLITWDKKKNKKTALYPALLTPNENKIETMFLVVYIHVIQCWVTQNLRFFPLISCTIYYLWPFNHTVQLAYIHVRFTDLTIMLYHLSSQSRSHLLPRNRRWTWCPCRASACAWWCRRSATVCCAADGGALRRLYRPLAAGSAGDGAGRPDDPLVQPVGVQTVRRGAGDGPLAAAVRLPLRPALRRVRPAHHLLRRPVWPRATAGGGHSRRPVLLATDAHCAVQTLTSSPAPTAGIILWCSL